MFSIKHHKANLNSCSSDVIFMLHAETNGIEIKCLCRTALISLGFFFPAFVSSKEGYELFQGSFLTVLLAYTAKICAKTEFLSNISVVKYFALKVYYFLIYQQHSCVFTIPFTSLLYELGC